MATISKRLIGFGLFISLSCCLTGSAQTKSDISHAGILSGEVADASENAPIPRAVLFLRGSGKREIIPIKLDSEGKFELSLAPGYYDIFVAADGFVPMCKVISMESEKTTKFSARLGPDSEHMQEGSSRLARP
jgi:hypothetical protein